MILQVLHILLYTAMGLILGNVFMSWIPPLQRTPFFSNWYELGERFLQPFRTLVRPIGLGGGSGIDLSPVIAFLVVEIVFTTVVAMLQHMGIT